MNKSEKLSKAQSGRGRYCNNCYYSIPVGRITICYNEYDDYHPLTVEDSWYTCDLWESKKRNNKKQEAK
jgi:hypothetical protein